MNTFNALSWSVSKGRDTYGYNIARLDSGKTGIRYRTMGGGYDMIGTVLGDLLENEYQTELQALVQRVQGELVDCGYSTPGYLKHPNLYGMNVKPDGRVQLDGGCGRESMKRVAERAGISITETWSRRGRRDTLLGFFISTSVEAV